MQKELQFLYFRNKNKKEEEDKDKKEEEESESDTSEEFQEFLDNMNKQNIEEFQQEENEENIPMGKETSRIAIQNIDWTNIHALDLFVLLNSFCKGNQKVLKVEIYPSEYGMKEMAKENKEGPDKKIFHIKEYDKYNKELLFSGKYVNGKRNGFGEEYKISYSLC